ncbi:peptide chain release factor N(5)-glutamine methyltransferase [Hespellia stercorisuis]|uniref:Release factor glutamine methyltransferase n=1 Tax=Hespellia stercorisuis DSM 15480 TaxID=1121950 RepID=A0A1M6HWN7_9FIRM|nr:peptide chain release factor N(5)-glutamine methyltransferase [Hespellia stercorisuis]SHJ26548.1 release factor glutamine methyltransferase [Hespellia stercorisuis DSM 15480]
MTLKELYEQGSAILAEAGIAEAGLDAWYLLEFVTKISRAMYYVHAGDAVCEEKQIRYQELVQKRAGYIPLQHLTGEQEFMGLPFFVDSHVLIPRQDTENLVECACGLLQDHMSVLDLCTGSGCILLSMEHFAREKKLQGFAGAGADVSKEALAVAEKNGDRLETDVTWIESDLFEKIEGKFDLIVSNPPYIRTSEIPKLQREVKDHDPMLALDGKDDGLYFYRRIIRESVAYIRPGGHLLFEIGFDQGAQVSALMREAGYSSVMVKKDLAGLDRVVSGVYQM